MNRYKHIARMAGLLKSGYVRRADGTFAKRVTIDGGTWQATETLVRTKWGSFHVERSARALAKRA